MTEAEKLDAMNRVCEELLGRDMSAGEHDYRVCSDDSPRSLIVELVRSLKSPEHRLFNQGEISTYSAGVILVTPAIQIVAAVLKVTGKWKSDWD